MIRTDILHGGALTLAMALPFGNSVACAANYALVVGINDYAMVKDLRGAVNDARWIAKSLSDFGVTEMAVFLDREATRANVEGTFFSYLDRAQPGDTIIFTYAGHGRYIEDLNGDEPTGSDPDDHYDETLVLAGFSPENPGEEIVDDELAQWFKEALSRNINLVFVSDSCHSGTVTRGGRLRLADPYAMSIEPIARPYIDPAESSEEDLDNLVFLSGAPEAKPVQEVMIEERYHGALSYSFGRALQDMRGDLDSDGSISRDELGKFVPRTARAFNEGRVLPDMVARQGPDFAVLVPDEAAGDFGEFPDAEKEPMFASGDFDTVRLTSRSDLVWNRRTGDITNADGEIVAANVAENRLPDVEAKFHLLDLAREGLVQEGFDIGLRSPVLTDAEVLRIGDGFTIEVGPIPYPFLTVFNLANNGEVQAIYPMSGSERAPQRVGTRISFDASAGEPVGIDHIVAFATREEPQTLRQQLAWSSTTDSFIPTLERLIVSDDVAVGLVSMATEER